MLCEMMTILDRNSIIARDRPKLVVSIKQYLHTFLCEIHEQLSVFMTLSSTHT